ncbi:hypothetical protein ACWEPN_30510 [Nonomuraea wenchangensis]
MNVDQETALAERGGQLGHRDHEGEVVEERQPGDAAVRLLEEP